jgi:hypothetical protein
LNVERRGKSLFSTSGIRKGMFKRANNIHIAGGTFAAPVQGDVVIYGHPSSGRQTGSGRPLFFSFS